MKSLLGRAQGFAREHQGVFSLDDIQSAAPDVVQEPASQKKPVAATAGLAALQGVLGRAEGFARQHQSVFSLDDIQDASNAEYMTPVEALTEIAAPKLPAKIDDDPLGLGAELDSGRAAVVETPAAHEASGGQRPAQQASPSGRQNPAHEA